MGTNSLSCLFSLALPWFLRGVINLGQGHTDTYVSIGSYGIQYIIISLLAILIFLYIGLVVCKFRLMIPNAAFYLVSYIGFLVFAILIEIDVIIPDLDRIC